MNSASWIGGPNYWMASSSTWNLSARGMPISAIFFPAFFNEGARGRFRVRVQYPINLGQMSQPQPDLVLYRPGMWRGQHPGAADISLVVQISEVTGLDFIRRFTRRAFRRPNKDLV